MTVENLEIKPYARLLTMLGEQLIKNEKVALIEIIKNSYDADAEWVKVNFSTFDENYQITQSSKIIIEDNGDGMDEETIKTQWLHPAAPGKKKKKEQKATTLKGRYIQGEKGIGRYALLKLGRIIKVITRPRDSNDEYVITYDFSGYDDEFTSIDGENRDIQLEELKVAFEIRKPEIIVEKNIKVGKETLKRPIHGTLIEISELKTPWTEKKVETIYKDLQKLQGIFPNVNKKIEAQADFNVSIYRNDIYKTYDEEIQNQLSRLLEEKTVFRIEGGRYDQKEKEFSYSLNGERHKISLSDPAITGLSLYKRNFPELLGRNNNRATECGDFDFNFYIFDFSPSASPKYKLDKNDKNLVKPHRIYLYRDGVRVYPYGDSDDDWLRIDQHRGTISAGHFLSNDQVMGRVNISHSGNPDLKDKTSREGLIEIGAATSDFIGLLQIFLAYIRKGAYKRYIEDNIDKKEIDVFKGDHIQKEIGKLKEKIEKISEAKDLKEALKKRFCSKTKTGGH